MDENKIAVLVNSRIEGNENSNILGLLKSICENSYNTNKIEVHIKFDLDDKNVTLPLIQEIERMPLFIHWIRGHRGRGYIDIHHGYNQLLQNISSSVVLIGAMADDFLVDKNWDLKFHEIIGKHDFDDLYIVHQRPHPPSQRPDYHETPFCLGTFPVFDKMEDLYVVDEAPFWSRKIVDCSIWLGGGLSFTDGWTLALEYTLWTQFGIKLTEFTDRCYIKRILGDNDFESSDRWTTDRKQNFDYVKSEYFRRIVLNQAINISRYFENKKNEK